MDLTQSFVQLLFFNIKEFMFLVQSISNGCFTYFLTLPTITIHIYPKHLGIRLFSLHFFTEQNGYISI